MAALRRPPYYDYDNSLSTFAAGVAGTTQRVRELAATFDAKAKASAEESNYGRLKRPHDAASGEPFKRRKLSIEHHRGQKVRGQAAPGQRVEPNRGPRVRLVMPPNPALQNAARRPKATMRPAGYNPPFPIEVIDTSSDEEEVDARLAWAKQMQTPVGGILPRDSHQDDIIVRSIENAPDGAISGFESYKEILGPKKSYNVIDYDFTNYRTNGKDPKDVPNLDRYRDIRLDKLVRNPDVDYTQLPRGVYPDEHNLSVYRGQTYNPHVPLAIIRIAQVNMPFISFNSALDHIPNFHPQDPLPHLPNTFAHAPIPRSFSDNIPHKQLPGDDLIKTIFIPSFYVDGRHVVGFYVRNGKDIQPTMVFTPCTSSDLQRFGLMMVFADDAGVWQDTKISTDQGDWYDKDASYEIWRFCWNFVAEVWEKRLRLAMGAEEDPN